MADKTLLELPLATTSSGALLYGVQNNEDKAFPPSVLLGNTAPQAANFVYAGPTAPPGGVPSFRRLVANDIPDLSNLYMATTGGNLVSPNINNPNIIGGTISGTRITVDDDKWFLRNATDTTKVIRFNAANISPGQTRIITVPDASGEVTLNGANQSLTNKNIVVNPSSTTTATFNIPHGSAPVAPVNGDIWTTSGGIYARVSGVTVGPLAAEQTSYVTSFNTRIGDVTLLPTDVTNALGYTPWNTSTNLVTSASITAGTVSDGSGNLRTAINTVNANANTKLPLAGGIVDGSLLVRAAGPTLPGIRFQSQNLNGSNRTTLESVVGNASAFAELHQISNGFVWYSNGLGETARLDNFGNFRSATLRAFGGNFATQVRLVERGWNNLIGRWVDVMETDGSLSLYSYDSTGGNPVQLLQYRTTVSGGGNRFVVNGTVFAAGGYDVGSDPALKDKESFRPVDNALEKLYNLNVNYGKYHDWYNPDGKERLFIMADNAMKQAVPQAVTKDMYTKDGVSYAGWSSEQMIALLVKAVQELTDKVNQLEERINE